MMITMNKSGSSPHTWGILLASSLPILVHRFIPTYVGHTMPRESPSLQYAVHPHIRGAYVMNVNLRKKPGRFIPTYVGHTVRVLSRALIPAVHPHIRGAYQPACKGAAGRCGSSPHTWGILQRFHHVRFVFRFIPTYVGHTDRG